MSDMAKCFLGKIPTSQGRLLFDGYMEGIGGSTEEVPFTSREVDLAAQSLFHSAKEVPGTSQAAILAAAYRELVYTPEALQQRQRSKVWATEE